MSKKADGTKIGMRFDLPLTNEFTKTVMPFRYYRLIAHKIWGGGTLTYLTDNGVLIISEFEIYAMISGSEQEIARGTSQGGGQVYSASSQASSTYSAAKAFDGTHVTWWQSAVTPSGGHWLKVDLGAGKGVSATKFIIKTESLQGVRDFVLEGSNDNTEWFMVYDGSHDGMMWDSVSEEFVCQPYYSYTNAPAFTATGQEPQWVEMPSQDLGTLVAGSYSVEKVEAHPKTTYHEDLLTGGTLSTAVYDDGWQLEGIILDKPAGYPPIATTSMGSVNTNATTTAITLPAGISVGDLIVLAFNKDGTGAPTTPSGWTLLYGQSSTTSYMSVFYRTATGSIAGFSITHASEQTSWICMRIPTAKIVDIASFNYDLGASVSAKVPVVPKPRSYPFARADRRLSLSIAGWDANVALSSYPTNRPDNRLSQIGTTTAGCGIAVATYNDQSVRFDEATFTLASTEEWLAYGIAIDHAAYTTSGYWITDAIHTTGFPSTVIVSWTENLLSGTSMSGEYAFTSGGAPSSWTSFSSGDTITVSDTHLWFKFSLATTNTANTPTLKSLIVQDLSASADEVLLTMKRLKHFQNVEGNLTVAYDFSVGNLAGDGGDVQNFSQSFTPDGLVRLPNPLLLEYITAQISAFTITVIAVTWRARYTDEAITAQTAISVTVTWVGTQVL